MSGGVSARRGSAALTVRCVAGQSAVVSAFSTEPLKLLTPISRGPSAWACVSSFGGGMVAGDETRLDLEVGAGATCFVGTQASTKVYRNPARRACGHQTRATVAGGGCLVFAPEVLQAFADSSYRQRQEFDLTGSANLVLVDWLSSGRSDCGEHWAFRSYQSRNEIRVDGRRRVVDAVLLNSESGAIAAPHRMGHWNCLAMLLMIGPGLATHSARLLEDIGRRPVEKSAPCVASASGIAGGALLRVAGDSVESVRRELQLHLDGLTGLLGDNPWKRKW